MAFNSPDYSENFLLEGYTQHQFLVIAIDAADKLKWRTTDISETGFITNTKNGLYAWNAITEVQIKESYAIIKSSTSNAGSNHDEEENKKTVQKFIETFNEIKSTYTEEQLAQKYEELKIDFTDIEEPIASKPEKTFQERANAFLSVFKVRSGYTVTPIIMYLNIAVFVMMVATGINPILPKGPDLINWGANFRPLTLQGQWWRLITSCFLHFGIMHLVLNMYALIYIGLLLERRMGTLRFATAYMLTGIASSTVSLWWHDNTVSAGASGAIFGLYGVFLAMLTTNLIEKDIRGKLLYSIGVFVFYNLVYGMRGGIDNAAHLGGLVSGLFIGYAFYPSLINNESVNLKYGIAVLLTVLITASSFVMYRNIPKTDNTIYIHNMMQFSDLEKKALKVYHLPADADKETLLNTVDTGIYYWNSCINLINGMDTLNLSNDARNRNKKVIEYCKLRIESYELIRKNYGDNSVATQISSGAITNYYNQQIRAILDSLKDK